MDNRERIVLKLLTMQTVVIAAVAIVFFALDGVLAACSAVIGGVISLSATALSCMHMLFGRMQWQPHLFLKQLFYAEALKIVLMSFMVLGAIKHLEILAFPMMLALVAVLLANWLVLLFDT